MIHPTLRQVAPRAPYPLLKLADMAGYGRVIDAFDQAANDLARDATLDPFAKTLENLGITLDITGDITALPKSDNPAIVIANHPFGMIEGLVLGTLIHPIRKDFKFMANGRFAKMIPFGQDRMIPVDMRRDRNGNHTPQAKRNRQRAKEEAQDHLRNGGVLALLPAGRIARAKNIFTRANDSPWYPFVGQAFIDTPGTTCLPITLNGQNSRFFQAIHMTKTTEKLRDLIMAHETVRLARKPIRIHIGTPLTHQDLPTECNTAQAVTQFLRDATYGLKHCRL